MKLALGFATAIALTVVVGTIAVLCQLRSRTVVRELLDKDVRVAELTLSSKADVLSAWRYETEFLARQKALNFEEAKIRYVTLVRSHEDEIRERMSAIRELTNSQDIVLQTRSIDQAVDHSGASFLKIVNLLEKRASTDTGLLGRIREKTQQIEKAVRQSGVDSLHLDQVNLRAAEQSYLLRGIGKEATDVQEAVLTLQLEAARETLDARQKQALQTLAADYLSLFNELVQLDERIAAELESYLVLRHTVEPLLQKLYAQTAQTEQATITRVEQFTRATIWTTLGTIAAAAAFGLLVARFISRDISGGVRECMDFAQKVAGNDLSVRLTRTGHDEFGGLAGALNLMAEHLERADASLRTEIVERELAQAAIHRANLKLESRVQERTGDLSQKNEELHAEMAERKRAQAELEDIHKKLLQASHESGMAEVATGILHNVGNVLNSVNVASSCVADSLRKSKAANLSKVVELLRENEKDLGGFLTNDPKGKQLPGYLAQLAEHLTAEQSHALKELAALQKNIEHIKEIVTLQQSSAKTSGRGEIFVNVADLVDDALRMSSNELARHEIEVTREFENVPLVTVEKHKVLQILVNLVRNAKHACDDSGRHDKRLTLRVTNGNRHVRIAVADNGIGIPPENLSRVFNYGFTTRKEGHGFGLHSGMLAAGEMGGSLTVHSDGPGTGAAFTLELPLPETGELT